MSVRRSAIVLSVVLLAGCGIFGRSKPTFYTLDAPDYAGTPRTLAGLPVAVDGIELPPGLDRREVVVRGADQRVEVRASHLWTAPLEEMVIHTLAFDLAKRLPEGRVILPGQARPAAIRAVYVTFEEFVGGPDQTFVLDARWTVTESGGSAQRAGHERITINMASKDSAAVVAAMSEALAQLADRIVAEL